MIQNRISQYFAPSASAAAVEPPALDVAPRPGFVLVPAQWFGRGIGEDLARLQSLYAAAFEQARQRVIRPLAEDFDPLWN